MGGLSGRTKLDSRHVLRAQCWPDGCRTFAFCRIDRLLPSYECLCVGILIAKPLDRIFNGLSVESNDHSGKNGYSPRQEMSVVVCPKAGWLQRRVRHAPASLSMADLHTLDAPLNQVNQVK